jgi:hypothetical protein
VTSAPIFISSRTGPGGYAVGQIFWTHTDAGGAQFNDPEIVGNATAVGIGECVLSGQSDRLE